MQIPATEEALANQQELMKMITRAIWVSCAAVLLLAAPLAAAEFRFDDKLTIGAEERIDGDLYAFGEIVVIDGVVAGDVIAFGSQVWINGTVEGDLMSASQALVISGTVSDDARVAGQVLKVDEGGKVAGDLVVGGFSLEMAPGGVVDGDVVYGGFQALLAGQIGGDVRGGLANAELSGETTGDVWLEVGGGPNEAPPPNFGPPPPVGVPSVAGGLTVTETAHVGGSLAYKSFHEAKIDPAAMIDGGIEFDQQFGAPVKEPTPADQALALGRRYGALLLVGLAAVLVAPTWTRRAGDNARSRLLACLGWGMVAIAAVVVGLIVFCIAAAILAALAGAAGMGGLVAVILIGGTVALLAAIVGMWLVCSYLAQVIVALAAGGIVARGSSRLVQALALALGLVVVLALTNVPYVAGVLALVIVFIGFGSLWLGCRDSVRRTRPTEQRTSKAARPSENPAVAATA